MNGIASEYFTCQTGVPQVGMLSSTLKITAVWGLNFLCFECRQRYFALWENASVAVTAYQLGLENGD